MTSRPGAADPACVFCRIVQGQVPCHKVYEDDHVLAFLDIGPLAHGHTVLIPKAHYTRMDELPADLAAACGRALPRLSRALAQATGAKGWNILQNNGKVAGQVVDHLHIHLIPRTAGDNLGYRWPAGKLDSGQARSLVQSITAALAEA